jgi:prephenate dehydrogenase
VRELRSVAVAGLGLIGGSLARDLAARGIRVLGHDRDPAAVDAALAEGVLAAALERDFGGLEDADAFVVAVPVRAAAAVLEAARPRLDTVPLVTDAGSTKRGIAAAAERLGLGARFVGGHPLAGDHLSGWAASRRGLFDGARVYLCPSADASAEARALARELWTIAGGTVVEMEAAEHDRLLAWTSHLPQIASSTLAAALAVQGIARADLGRGGRDVTRLAGSSAEVWTDIALDNADFLLDGIDGLRLRLDAIRDALAAGDRDGVREFFLTGRGFGGG